MSAAQRLGAMFWDMKHQLQTYLPKNQFGRLAEAEALVLMKCEYPK